MQKAILKSFDSATYQATVQLIGSQSVWLVIPTSRGIPSAEMVAGRKLAVGALDPANPNDMVVLAVYT
ncbi:MAG TPA: hypothetical protein VNL15_05150 [Dehalococcoidia bacterium]|nr:hypothetical protein [Dehalococcoidia bacterium]